MTRISALSLEFVFVLTGASPTFAQADGQKVLDEWAKFAAGGTWVTTRANGEKQESTYRWRTPGKLLEHDGRGGPLPFVAMIAVDPSTNKCEWTVSNDDGTTAKGALTQPAEGVWIYEESGAGPNGPHKYKAQITRVDADTTKEAPSEFVVNGKPQPLDPATWKRTGQATRQDFANYCRDFQGRFVGKVTWVADWPGLGKKGETVTAYYEGRATADGNVMVGTIFAGAGTISFFAWYDAQARQIKSRSVDSGGSVAEFVTYKQDGKWHERSSGSLADGTPTSGQFVLTISDGGDTHRWSGTGTVGGKPTDPLQDEWHRVSKK